MNLLNGLKALKVRRSIKRAIAKADSIRVIFGAGGTSYPGWISTDYPVLDVTDEKSWPRLFKVGTVDSLLSEHVLEHLTDEQLASAIPNIYRYLKIGGHVRIAVPDGYHPNAEYIEAVKPGGSGSGSDDHKQLFNCHSLASLLEKEGFTVQLLEWFNERGEFNFNDWLPQEGMVMRSSRYDERNLNSPLSYTSLILDAYKS